jgi:nitroreductase
VLVVVGGDTRSGTTRRSLPSSVLPAVQNLLLAAAALGYGSALTTLATFASTELRSLLELPDGVEPLVVVPVGRPARPLGPARRQPVAAKAHRERYAAGVRLTSPGARG